MNAYRHLCAIALTASMTCLSTPTLARDADAPPENPIDDVVVSATRMSQYIAGKIGIAGKTPQAWRDVPHSVSVMSRAQMDDQNLNTAEDALRYVTGVQAEVENSLESNYKIRGFNAGGMFDGVASHDGMQQSHQFDLPIYERIEVLRGPEGVLRGSGEPGGVIHFVKKRPQKDFAATWRLSAGSWDHYRAEGDISSALNQDGSLRGRVVLMAEDRRYFYRDTHSKKWLGMLALEYDPTPNTTLSLSHTVQNQDVDAVWRGLPTGTKKNAEGIYPQLNVARSTNYVPDWNATRYRTAETSFSGEHRFDNGWMAKLKLNHRLQKLYYKSAMPSTGVNPDTGTLNFRNTVGDYDYTRDGADLSLTAPFRWFGREHSLLIGTNLDEYDYRGKSGGNSSFTGVPFGDTSQMPEPEIPYTSGMQGKVRQHGFYSQLHFQATDSLHIVLGGRSSRFTRSTRNIAPSKPTDWQNGPRAKKHFTPYAAAVYTLNDRVSFYGSYADIFVPQAQKRADGSMIDPRIGRQFELGAKSTWLDERLNASLAWFDIRDRNRAYLDPDHPPAARFYLNAGEVKSSGWEAEITGSPYPGWDIVAGYTYLKTRYLKDNSREGQNFSAGTPKHQFKLWTQYRFNNASALSGLSLGMGVLANSNTQSANQREEIPNSGYAVVNAQIAYRLNKNYSLAVDVGNLFDKKYYSSVGNRNVKNMYGEPRSVVLTLRGKY
ncbi:MAG: TonB-dependent siderophore receptor [Neisseria sp.]|nr:TonB-dependent siderophore receptor [Neisseria sp.]